MYIKNALKPGDYLEVVPNGIPITLQYNDSGNLERIFRGFYDTRQADLSSAIKVMLSNHTVPQRLTVKTGTSWVEGILYTGKQFYDKTGFLPDATENVSFERYLTCPSAYNFFAGMIHSTAKPFIGAMAVRNCLQMSGFNLLPGWIVPSSICKEVFYSMVSGDSYTFKVPFIASYIIFRGAEVIRMNTNIYQCTVKKTETYTDKNGYVKSRVYTSNAELTLCVDYSECVKYQIQKNQMLLLDADKQIIYSECAAGQTEKISNTIPCTGCGKLITVPDSGPIKCQNTSCKTHLHEKIVRMCTVLKIELPMSDADLENRIDSRKFTSVAEFLNEPEFSELRMSTSIPSIMRSLIPISTIPNSDIFEIFACRCSNNLRAFQFYISNPHQIQSDLSINNQFVDTLVNWLCDPVNISDVLGIINSGHVDVSPEHKLFNGAPIFRNKTICITGDFLHGNMTTVSSILQSYQARITVSFSADVDVVITGATMDSIDGKIIQAARDSGVPIYGEAEFFNMYGIDDDITNESML